MLPVLPDPFVVLPDSFVSLPDAFVMLPDSFIMLPDPFDMLPDPFVMLRHVEQVHMQPCVCTQMSASVSAAYWLCCTDTGMLYATDRQLKAEWLHFVFLVIHPNGGNKQTCTA